MSATIPDTKLLPFGFQHVAQGLWFTPKTSPAVLSREYEKEPLAVQTQRADSLPTMPSQNSNRQLGQRSLFFGKLGSFKGCLSFSDPPKWLWAVTILK